MTPDSQQPVPDNHMLSALAAAIEGELGQEIAAKALGVLEERLARAELLRRQALEIYANLLERQTLALADLTTKTESERQQLRDEVRALHLALAAAQEENAALQARRQESAADAANDARHEEELLERSLRLEQRLQVALDTNQDMEVRLADCRDHLAAADERLATTQARADALAADKATLDSRLTLLQEQWERLATTPGAEV